MTKNQLKKIRIGSYISNSEYQPFFKVTKLFLKGVQYADLTKNEGKTYVNLRFVTYDELLKDYWEVENDWNR